MRLLSSLCCSHKTSHFSPAKVPKSSANVTAKVWRHAKILQWLRRLTLRWSDSSSSSKCCRWRRVFPPRSYQTWRAPDEWSLIRKFSLSASFIGHEKRESRESEVFLWLKSLTCRVKSSFMDKTTRIAERSFRIAIISTIFASNIQRVSRMKTIDNTPPDLSGRP